MQTLFKKLLALSCLLLSINFAIAQNPLWTLPPKYFSNTGPGPLPSAYSTYFNSTTPYWNSDGYVDMAHAAMPDAQGNPLFYVMDGFVFDKSFNKLGVLQYYDSQCSGGTPNVFSGGVATCTGYSQVLILPDPNNCKQYYILNSASMGAILADGSCYDHGGFSDGTGAYFQWSGKPSTSSHIFWNPGTPSWFYPFYSIVDVSLIGTGTTPIYTTSKTYYNADNSCHCTGGSTSAQNTAYPLLIDSLYKGFSGTGTSFPNRANGIHYAASKVITGTPNYQWVFISDGGTLYKLKFTGSYSGNTNAFTLISKISLPLAYLANDGTSGGLTSQPFYDVRAEMELVQKSNGDYEIAVPYLQNLAHGSSLDSLAYAIYIADLNSSADITSPVSSNSSNVFKIGTYFTTNTPSIHGLEFSPDGSNLYLTHDATTAYPNPIEVISTSTYVKSAVSATGGSSFAKSQIEAYTDGKLYFADGSNLATYDPGSSIWNATASSITYGLTNPSNAFGGGLYSYQKSYLLPTQVDGMNYSTFQKPTGNLACCLFYNAYDKFTYDAGQATPSGWSSTNQTWRANNNPLNNGTGNTVTIGEELRIPAGYTVTIDSMTIKFSPQARLIIENGTTTSLNGGSLVLNNCTLKVDTRCANDMWPGVQVWGTPGNSHDYASQGSLFLNNSQIQDSYNAVIVGYSSNWQSTITANPGAPILGTNHLSIGTGFFTGGGGVIQATNTTFLNNQMGLAMYSYTNSASPNNNVLTKCSFLVNSALLASGVTPAYHVYMIVNTEGFYVVGTSFSDTYYQYNDYGIYAYNSNFAVGDYYGSAPLSSFNRLKYGIYALNGSGVGSTSTMSCNRSMFTLNYYGIYLGNVNNAIIETDTFNLYPTSCTFCTKPYSYGIYLDNSTSYSIRDNLFKENGSGSTYTNKMYGIIANNAPNDNIIFRNKFQNVYIGNQSQFQNYIWSSTSPQNGINGGLQYLCNTFVTGSIKSKDIYVAGNLASDTITYTGTSHVKNAGIDYWQGDGSSGYPATGGNRFSHTSGGYDFYIDTITHNVYNSTYIYYCPSGTCSSSSIYPLHYTSQVLVSPSRTDSTDCTHNPYTCTGCRTANENQAMLSEANGYLQSYNSLKTQIDGGSTSGLLSLVQGNNNSQAVYNSLNVSAPYLSDDVLKAYINSSYPTSDIIQILTSCAPLTDEVNKAVNASNLSSTIKSQLLALQTGTPKLFQLYSNMSTAFSSRQLILDELIRGYVHDSIQAKIQQGYALMKVKALELPARTQLQAGLDLNDTAMATNALAQVINEEGQSNFVKLHNMLLQNMNKSAEQITDDSSVVSDLQAMSKDSSDRLTYYKVHALLRIKGLSNYVPYIITNDNEVAVDSTSNERKAQQPVTIVASSSTLINQPNPFKENTTVTAFIVEKTQNAFIVITDMVGNEVARYPVQQGENSINVNAGGLNQAVMFCTLIVDGVKIKTNKMLLMK